MARANKKYKSAIDLMYASAPTPLDDITITLTSFSSGDKLSAFIRGFYGLKGLPSFFTVFTDHKPLLHCFTKKEILVHDFTELKCN